MLLTPAILADAECAGNQVMALLTNKWTVHIMVVLAAGTSRYGQIYKNLPNVSHKMLSQTLRALERKTLIQREVFPAVPPHVEYSLTDLGKDLYAQLILLAQWAEDHATELGCRPHIA